MRPNDIYTVDDLVDNLRECAKDWLYCGGSDALEEQFELASEAIRERVTDFEVKVTALQKELDELKERYRWHNIEVDGLPELDQDVEIINMRTMEMQAGHFFDYEEGNPTAKDIMFDDHNDTTFALDELPKKYQWRYLNAPKGGE
jgi:hypothetical protein